MNDGDLGKIMRELSEARKESREAIRRAYVTAEQAKNFIERTEREMRKLADNDTEQTQATIDLRLKMREIDTIRKLGWALVSLMFSTFVGLGYTVIRNDEQIEQMQQEIRGHVSAAGHPQSTQTINEVKNELGKINSSLDEWKKSKDEDIKELKDAVKRRRYR